MASDAEGAAERDGAAPSAGPPHAQASHYQPACLDPLGSPQHVLAPRLLDSPQPAGRAELDPLAGGGGVAEPHPLSASSLIPLEEVVGASLAEPMHDSQPHPHCAAPQPPSDEDDSSCGMDSPARRGSQQELELGYESSDDMDFMNTRHCINCTGELWGNVCRACGYMDGHEASIFDPVVAPPLRPGMLRCEGSTVIAYDDRMLLHDENQLPLHPERADRLRAVMARLNAAQLTGRCRRLPSREAMPQEVERCHTPELMSVINVLSERSRLQGNETLHWPTSDTYVNQHTAMCARLSAGACVDVAVAVARGEAASGVAVVRPPGHHAESNTAMGFCFFNNAGIAARAAQAAGAKRVIIVDWDVHHGNGTQHIFEGDSSVMYMSLHRYDEGQFYPGTGAVTEVGSPGAEGTTVNVPWPCGHMRNGDYMAAFQHLLMPIALEFAPDLMIISAGFDAAEGDPIGGCCLTPEVYAHMTAMLQAVAPTVLLLEGGYNLMSVAKATEACVRVLLGDRPPPLPPPQHASEAGMGAVAAAMRVQARYWRCVQSLLERLAPAQPPASLLGTTAHAAAALRQELSSGGGQLGHSHDEEAEWEEDTDTPHVQNRGAQQFALDGSGWESDVELQSGGSLGGVSMGGGASLAPLAAGGGCGGSSARLAAVEGASAGGLAGEEEEEGGACGNNSDTELESEDQSCGGEEGTAAGGEEVQQQQQQEQQVRHAHLASSHPLHAAAVDTASPDLLPLLGEEECPAGAVAAGAVQAPSQQLAPAGASGMLAVGEQQQRQPHGGDDGSGSAALNWRKLALKVVAMKRAAHKAPRLSPQLLREAQRDLTEG